VDLKIPLSIQSLAGIKNRKTDWPLFTWTKRVFLKSNQPQINTDEKDLKAFWELFSSRIDVYLRSSVVKIFFKKHSLSGSGNPAKRWTILAAGCFIIVASLHFAQQRSSHITNALALSLPLTNTFIGGK
jgi:hypothetical protein